MIFRNQGKVPHDAFVGDTDAQADHEKKMRSAGRQGGGLDMGGDDRAAITVDPGKTAELIYTFKQSGRLEVGATGPGTAPPE